VKHLSIVGVKIPGIDVAVGEMSDLADSLSIL
jgi:hypothetical protein